MVNDTIFLQFRHVNVILEEFWKMRRKDPNGVGWKIIPAKDWMAKLNIIGPCARIPTIV